MLFRNIAPIRALLFGPQGLDSGLESRVLDPDDSDSDSDDSSPANAVSRVYDFAFHRVNAHRKGPMSEPQHFRIAKNYEGQFWCGFCNLIVVPRKPVLDPTNYRFEHVANHFIKERKDVTSWVELYGWGRTKEQMLLDSIAQNNPSDPWEQKSGEDFVKDQVGDDGAQDHLFKETIPFPNKIQSDESLFLSDEREDTKGEGSSHDNNGPSMLSGSGLEERAQHEESKDQGDYHADIKMTTSSDKDGGKPSHQGQFQINLNFQINIYPASDDQDQAPGIQIGNLLEGVNSLLTGYKSKPAKGVRDIPSLSSTKDQEDGPAPKKGFVKRPMHEVSPPEHEIGLLSKDRKSKQSRLRQESTMPRESVPDGSEDDHNQNEKDTLRFIAAVLKSSHGNEHTSITDPEYGDVMQMIRKSLRSPKARNFDASQSAEKVQDQDESGADVAPMDQSAIALLRSSGRSSEDNDSRPLVIKREDDECDSIDGIPDNCSNNKAMASASPIWSQESGVMSPGEESFISDFQSAPSLGLGSPNGVNELVLRLGSELAVEFLASTRYPRTCAPQGSEESSSRSNGTCSTTTCSGPSHTATELTSQSSGKRRFGVDEDEEDAQAPKRPRLAKPDSNDMVPDNLLACPFAKYDPTRFSERNQNRDEKPYRRCASVCLTSIARLKQHLYRVHRRPEYYCSSCFMEFEANHEREAHSRMRPSCTLRNCPFEEKMTVDQWNAVKRRQMRVNPADAWFGIFKLLFPEAPLPDNPHISGNGSPVVMQSVQNYTSFLVQRLPQRLSVRLYEPLYGGDDTWVHEWYVNQVLEETLPLVLWELHGEYQTLVPAQADDSESS